MSIIRAFAVAISVALLPSIAFAAESKGAPKFTDIVIETSAGNFTLRVNSEKAPISAENFLKYVDEGFYNGTVFHRVINNFMVQGGGFTPDMKQKATKGAIKNEAGNGLKNIMGTVAMARTSEVNSATAQFFVNVKDNSFLDHKSDAPNEFGYAVFGEVISGMDTIDKMKVMPTCPGTSQACAAANLPAGFRDVPATPIIITKASRKK
ncbi:MAG: peptidyl-prolyl cis-trans isomerase [Clostridia bacterium]|nr:peptidyl-prolyl cis-trans isomerase [Deltaproteobacteria bacterium]